MAWRAREIAHARAKPKLNPKRFLLKKMTFSFPTTYHTMDRVQFSKLQHKLSDILTTIMHKREVASVMI